MHTKQEAIQKIVRLIKKYNISFDEISDNLQQSKQAKTHAILKKFLAFIGGIFIFCGLGIYIADHWSEMNSIARILITLGTGCVLFILAVIASRDLRYRNVLTPLFILAAIFETIGMFVAVHELYPGGKDPRYVALVIFAALFIQHIIVFLSSQRTVLLFAAIFFASAFFFRCL